MLTRFARREKKALLKYVHESIYLPAQASIQSRVLKCRPSQSITARREYIYIFIYSGKNIDQRAGEDGAVRSRVER